MKVTNARLIKTSLFWLVVLERENGERNDYRFATKSEARAWARRSGIELAN